MKPIELHLVSWNRPKMTELVIRTIHKNTKPESFRLVVFDNDSERETVNMLIDLQENGLIDELHVNTTNEGLEKARQWLLLNGDPGEFFICIDNDCLPPEKLNGLDWIVRLVDLMQRYEDFAAISCRTQVMIGTGNIFEEADATGSELVEFPHPGGSLRIMRTAAVKQVGGWDREASGRGAEERFICGKLRDAGYRTAFAAQIPTLHLFGTRGEDGTDRWGYDAKLEPADTGHSDISHPALTNGDDRKQLLEYASITDVERYYD